MPRRKEPRIPDAVLDQLLAEADSQAVFDVHSGESDRPFRPKVITDSGDRDHADHRRRDPA